MLRRLIVFLGCWLALGFSVGTLTLLGPARWVVSAIRSQGSPDSWEEGAIRIIVAALTLITGLLAWKLSRFFLSPSGKSRKLATAVLMLAALGTSLWHWLHPQGLQNQNFSNPKARFTIGPAPVEQDFVRLKKEGYTAVLSLLSPAVVPFEPILLQQEEGYARQAGLTFINIPILPWLSDNIESIEKIRNLARSPHAKEGRIYIHCYLGTDRVQIARRILEQMGETVATIGIRPSRTLDELPAMERGKVVHLPGDVYLVPYPTDEEFFGYLLNDNVRTVVSLLNPRNAADKPYIEREEKLLKEYGVAYRNFPLPKTPNLKAMRAVIENIASLEHPVAVHEFRSDTPIAQTFLKAYQSTD